MSDAPRPSLKLTLGKKKAPPEEPPQIPPTPTSSATPQRKITLKIARRPEPKKEDEKPKKKKSSKKRPAEEPAEGPVLNKPSASVASAQPTGPKRIKLIPSKKPGVQSIRIKNKGLVPNRPVGVGYDSEASDTEIDPCIEEQFILRMLPGEDCEYLRQAINERRFDRSEFSFKPLSREGRRAVLRIRDKQYAAALVDLPCIIEGMKSWDRRGWYKSADICQMLLVLGPVANDSEALTYPLPSDVHILDDKTLQYQHGLAPPLQWVRKRRFRERLSTRTIEQVEKAVEDLITQDEAALSTRYELLDSASLNRAEGFVQSGEYYDEYDEYDDEQDAEGEEYEGMEEAMPAFDGDDDLAAEMEAALAEGAENAAKAAAAAIATAGAAPSDAGMPHLYQAGTPMATKPSTPAADSSDESDMSDADEADVPEDELDDEQLEQQRQFQQHHEEIAELEALIRAETAKWEKMQNQILKGKLAKRIQDLKRDLSLKKVSVGEGEDADT